MYGQNLGVRPDAPVNRSLVLYQVLHAGSCPECVSWF